MIYGGILKRLLINSPTKKDSQTRKRKFDLCNIARPSEQQQLITCISSPWRIPSGVVETFPWFWRCSELLTCPTKWFIETRKKQTAVHPAVGWCNWCISNTRAQSHWRRPRHCHRRRRSKLHYSIRCGKLFAAGQTATTTTIGLRWTAPVSEQTDRTRRIKWTLNELDSLTHTGAHSAACWIRLSRVASLLQECFFSESSISKKINLKPHLSIAYILWRYSVHEQESDSVISTGDGSQNSN